MSEYKCEQDGKKITRAVIVERDIDVSTIWSFRYTVLEYRYNLGLQTLWSETEICCNTDIVKTVGLTVLPGKFLLEP